jgi:ABC-type transporter Mla maintaining outer membrane lipid asymmetry permease subunit MlaE
MLRHWIQIAAIGYDYRIYNGLGFDDTIATKNGQIWRRILADKYGFAFVIREIAPVITALICAGNIASGIDTELSSMKVSSQIDAMEVSAINPYKYLVVTRVMATTIMVPIQVIYANLVGIFEVTSGIMCMEI